MNKKKLLWTALTAIVSAGAAALAMRALSYGWRRVAHEDPPEQPKWAQLLLGLPLKKGVSRTVEATG